MKASYCVIVLYSVLVHAVSGQTPVQLFKGFDIQNTSSQTLDAINSEFRAGPNANEFRLLIAGERQRLGDLRSQQSTENYLKEFGTVIDKTRTKHEAEEFLRKTEAELIKYGVGVAGSYAQALPTKHLTNFLVSRGTAGSRTRHRCLG